MRISDWSSDVVLFRSFLDDTACNLASLNLMAFRRGSAGGFDIEAYEHAVRLWTLTLEIAVLMAQFPSAEIAQRSYDFRTLGLGYANIGGLRSEEHTSELQSLMRISYAVFCLKKKNNNTHITHM